ncbi:hypothetical protein L226DRAFT_575124 [Lentinus tigrinus ALCF2SS1-7]|uniref:Uncharacterized protein n=1 Tax=Lentinus tigrinus ALCF2SS1-6 TaxID=1328759 RepID=A0A5C2RSB1_9APHY|nr:hypothetical protein L227DRAFT_616075 [Lentinus tigrinus ALCF2SS1-6]RPD70031.1 hypothetical protein L226DRAFT_575124 [Lentinus tigrinus ALCF2SS1-7]
MQFTRATSPFTLLLVIYFGLAATLGAYGNPLPAADQPGETPAPVTAAPLNIDAGWL